jgi:hypothetical protein
MSSLSLLWDTWLSTPAWIVVWQSTLWLALGLAASRLLHRHAARGHLMLVLAMAAALVSPVLTSAVRRMEWGVLPARKSVTIDATRASDLVTAPDSPGPPDARVSNPGAAKVGKFGPSRHDLIADSPASRTAAHSPDWQTNTRSIPSGNSWRIGLRDCVPSVVVGIWVVCSLLLLIRLAVSLFRGGRVVRQAALETHPKLLATVREAADRLAVQTGPVLRTSPAVRCPMIWCWGRRPVLLTPPSAALQDGVSWLGVFSHELAHWIRRDHWSALWAEVVVIALPWQPLAWHARRRLAFLREQACDDWVLAAGGEATDYAESLLNLVPQGSPAYVLTAVRSHASLRWRLEHVLLGARVPPKM